MTELTGARMLGLGVYRPARVVTNDEIAQRVDTSDAWIQARTGIASRRIADDEETIVAMGAAAAEKALAAAGLTADSIDLVIGATCTSPSQIPGAGPQIAHRIGAGRAGAFDINGACAGFSYAVSTAADMVRAGTLRNVLVVATERLSDYTDWDDRSTCILLADGAGAAVIGPAETNEIGPAVWGHDGSRPETIQVPGYGDNSFRMEGQAVFRWAISLVPVLRQICEQAGVAPEDLAGIVPHQANLRIVEALVTGIGATNAAVARDVVDAGNTSAASIPLGLSRLLESGEIRRGDPVLLFGFGAGLTYCGQLVRCP
ncbi:3-oxoacyl-(acyl-carrier-protein) synthase III [Frankia casuarinae]|uniref:Beta-ketoacyl-[acyl-carrier-protein] synthase III n=2 Tax=Frankia casuarinae (strain DSM 45818 / CECT 9043 / HFP020203 / CcI3) TaxID=106370 RepID=Q2J7A7_FRACC|nr:MULTISPECIES: beta-ketoacyl-ACP synthase III [Frankia]ABD12835.1 3-oxoacyl-[acyl-carrier-protein] synthase III [Frankia casuarinae]ETA03291.1 3-oxoacyl-(acyl-carrier-protein) synthase III [Frankia sp. CcI6]EYT92683.1 3-oxoacyl-(acyl-carrier-protein) synthase III [Frankia casuarinae]KDA43618.1 3-oxoacyl-(acyl-carrier-protein) synthase III [Frankia sp. BMG5.23]KEZ36926.1 3-oxoacyl-(acyl-carrier-protein) synthase III [Frankia sp. CeD]